MEDITKNPKLNNFSLSLIDEKVDLRGLYYALLAEKWIVVGALVISLILGVIYAICITPTYESSALLQAESKQMGMDVGFISSSLSKQISPSDIQMTLIKSRFILVPVVESLGLDVEIHPHYFPIGRKLFSHIYGQKYVRDKERLEISTLEVFPGSRKDIFKLVADKDNSYKLYSSAGRFLLHGKVGELQEITTDKDNIKILVKTLVAHPSAEFSITKLRTFDIADKIAAHLQISDLGQMYQFDKTGVLEMSLKGPQPQYLVNVLNKISEVAIKKDVEHKVFESEKTLKFLNEELPLVKKSLSETEASLNQHRMTSGSIDLTVKSKMILKQLTQVQQEIEKANINRIMLLQQLTPEHPFIIALQDKKTALEAELANLEKELQVLPASDQIAVSLMRDIKVKTQLYLMLLNRIQETQVMRAATISDLRVLHAAQIPTSSLPTGRLLIILASILFGFIAGSLLVIVRKTFKRYIEDPNWLEQQFGIPTFAIIPHSREQKINVQAYQNQEAEELSILAKTQPRDLAVEALRSLRTSLQFALIGAKNNIISIMGVSPGIGKSFVSANFSHILAESGKRILLIDGDIRKGYLQNYFKINRVPGLSEVLCGQSPLINVIQKTHLETLDFIPTGNFPPNPSEILMSNNFKELLSTLSTQYDLIVIDTAPILAVTDGVIISGLCGVNFLVLANSTHQAEEVELAVKRLQSNKVIVQGGIFNNIHISTHSQGRFNYYYQYDEKEKID